MNPKCLFLSRSQLSVAWNRSRFNHYSDNRKQKFHDNIGVVYDKLMEVDFETPTLSEDDQRFYKKVLEFSKDSLSLLDNNTISSVPHEFIECLNVAAKEWIADFDDYIIVMKDGPYAIMPHVDEIKTLYALVRTRFGVDFQNILLSVSMPRQLSRDYFTNVCLFHELGHFIDTKYKIFETVSTELMNEWLNGKKTEIEKWFLSTQPPFFTSTSILGGTMVYKSPYTVSFIKEYFADIFAAQYVGEKFLYYLEYISDTPKDDSYSHPSYEKRYQMYQDYTKGFGSNIVLDTILGKTKDITKQDISKRFVDMVPDDMYGFLPTNLKDEKEIYSIFNMGWDAYMAGSEPFEKANGLITKMPPDRLYEAVNNLIEKSINNFLVLRDWNNAKMKS